jgi:hypothetical protein
MTLIDRNVLSEVLAQWRRRMVALGWIHSTFVAAGNHSRVVWED